MSDPSGLGLYPNYAWTWPDNTRILYNRASCDAEGQPMPARDAKGNILAPAVPVIRWDPDQKKWVGHDTPDVRYLDKGPDTPEGQMAFRQSPEGVGRLFAAAYEDPYSGEEGVPRDVAYVPKDGPLPEFYEPVESPVANALHPGAQCNPVLKYPRAESMQPIGTTKDYPYVLMTSTVAEHWCGGSTTRNLPWLNELVPEPMIELPIALAEKLGIETGDLTRVTSARGEIVVKAVVTRRMRTLQISGQEVHDRLDPLQLGLQGPVHRAERQRAHDRRRRSGRGHPGDQGLPGERRSRGRPDRRGARRARSGGTMSYAKLIDTQEVRRAARPVR